MKAAVFDRYGPPEVLRIADVATPTPGDGDILVRIRATVATPPDCAFRSGNPFIVRFFTGLLRPKYRIIGTALAGIVESVGAGVTRFAPGDRIYGASDVDFGTTAEFKCLPQDGSLAVMPANLDFGDIVALSEGFLTAMPYLRDEAQLAAGQRILVNGASGSIGTVAVQLARHMGAHVTAVCSARNHALVLSLGADAVLDYTKVDFTAGGETYDVVFDTVGKSAFSRCRRILTPQGRYMTTVPALGGVLASLMTRKSKGKRAIFATTGLRPIADKVRDLQLLNDLVEAGVLRAVIDRRYPIEGIAEAHRYVDTGHKVGGVVIDIGH